MTSLRDVLREYVRDLRRCYTSRTDSPGEQVLGVADYLETLIERAHTCDAAQSSQVRAATIEECAKVAETEAQGFLSPQYAANQPFGSICERFACERVAEAIRNLAAQPPAAPVEMDARNADSTIWGMIKDVYGDCDAEDAAWIDRKWADWRGLKLAAPVETRTCATCHAVLADGPQPAATYERSSAATGDAEMRADLAKRVETTSVDGKFGTRLFAMSDAERDLVVRLLRDVPQPVEVSADQAAEDVRREREAKAERDRYAKMTTAEKCAVQGDGFINDYD